MSPGQAMVGNSVSSTITRKELVTPSVLVNVTVLVPIGKKDPLVGEKTNWAQSPVVIGGAKFTTAPHWPGSLFVMVLTVPIRKHVFVTSIVTMAGPEILLLFNER